MAGMTVNFNNLRKQAVYAYESLCEKLNDAILTETQYATRNDVKHGQEIDIKGNILIDAEDIQKDMDNLRSMIGSIAMTYEEGDDNFQDVYQQIFPDENQSMKSFNDEDEV
jgi:hypothetical protein